MTQSSFGKIADDLTDFFTARHDLDKQTFWLGFSNRSPQYFSLDLLNAMERGLNILLTEKVFRYFVMYSEHGDVFNLGGDLAFFHDRQMARDRLGLESYATRAAALMANLNSGFDRRVTTVALVQGKCFGGGFEAALACHYIFAEKHATFCFPEIQLGIFPGMGALRILARRLSARNFAALCHSGASFSAQELMDMGLVEGLAEAGEGDAVVQAFIRKRHNGWAAHQAMLEIFNAFGRPVSAEFGVDVKRWVDCVMNLDRRQLALMSYAIEKQQRGVNGTSF